ncbi:MAG: hypothetical protein P9M08_12325 [Candidatus Erginobacter occultus]|nr:hypothetical protein [Candidatus Erginobacter occultus]
MKKSIHIFLLVFGGLLAAGALSVRFLPSLRGPLPGPEPAAIPAAGAVSLLLGPAPAGPSERTGRREFAFGETIYATVAIEDIAPGEHALVFRWVNPRGGIQESFRKEFYSSDGRYRAWSWLELEGEEWLALPLGPLGAGRFLGRWRIEVELDGAPLAGAGFTVR